MILILLVIPIYLLYHFKDDPETPHGEIRCMGILLVATLAFSACISLFTRKSNSFFASWAQQGSSFLTGFLRREKT
jgi:hypothetical protein